MELETLSIFLLCSNFFAPTSWAWKNVSLLQFVLISEHETSYEFLTIKLLRHVFFIRFFCIPTPFSLIHRFFHTVSPHSQNSHKYMHKTTQCNWPGQNLIKLLADKTRFFRQIVFLLINCCTPWSSLRRRSSKFVRAKLSATINQSKKELIRRAREGE